MQTQALITDQDGHPTWRYRVEPFQQEIERRGLTISELAAQLGRDEAGLARALGYRPPCQMPKKPRVPPNSVKYETAAQVAVALDLDLVEWGI